MTVIFHPLNFSWMPSNYTVMNQDVLSTLTTEDNTSYPNEHFVFPNSYTVKIITFPTKLKCSIYILMPFAGTRLMPCLKYT